MMQPLMTKIPEPEKSSNTFRGRAVPENLTVSVLYHVDLVNLAALTHEQTFSCHTHLTDSSSGDNRDAYLLPGALKVNGESRNVRRYDRSGKFSASSDMPSKCCQ